MTGSLFTTGRLLMGGLSVAAASTVSYWVGGKIREAQFDRIKFGNKYTKENHDELVSSIDSNPLIRRFRQITPDEHFNSRGEEKIINISYFRGYLPRRLQEIDGTAPPIFRYDDSLRLTHPFLDDIAFRGFVFAGPSSKIQDPSADKLIHDGDYIRCKSELEIGRGEDREKLDVIIAGTTDPSKCKEFKRAYLRDLAYLAATTEEQINPQHPHVDTPVFINNPQKKLEKAGGLTDFSGIEKTGDLSNLPERVKSHIRNGSYTTCDFFTYIKTVQSNSSEKRVGAIVAGLKDENVCDYLYSRAKESDDKAYKDYLARAKEREIKACEDHLAALKKPQKKD